MSIDLHYLVILDSADRPILFKNYRGSEDELGIQLHCYACLDFIGEKLQARGQQFLGKIYSIFNSEGQYSIFGFYTMSRIKILAIFKQENPSLQINEEQVNNFCLNVYKLYKRQLLQAFSTFESTGRFTKHFYQQLDSYAEKTKFRTQEKPK